MGLLDVLMVPGFLLTAPNGRPSMLEARLGPSEQSSIFA